MLVNLLREPWKSPIPFTISFLEMQSLLHLFFLLKKKYKIISILLCAFLSFSLCLSSFAKTEL